MTFLIIYGKYKTDIQSAYDCGKASVALCEDTISRENVEECKELMTDTNGDLVYVVRMSDIRQLPPVKQQPKIGQWIGHREHCENLGVMPSGLGVYEWCSNCDCGIDVREWHRNHYNYCPNCGAKMESEET